mmetsp:Transcript_26682/g.40924  ORF Transcript_26682/g.40924 Transcript_26682/m.40924 type:complete len:145 (+) Transcript_26682:61-495(+)|eukprot:CAMPEP_0118688424 /NCGR_PEP_ID=MMETSP0800-20121206/8914_1 /TAXON_ID=210618 ORGANISM="Striatella unipunctata, Strain CCMP2910" /NCGR_SAMPLE_ID=MMETSP0800 /ASSEMBLY_ACC=CAM_ASM_000638 /LENGTH=144 /DNA_ID=CAMNT_0006585685 /DNA_START=51 /DNA_END=485 /DNA_ORIENTATION=-
MSSVDDCLLELNNSIDVYWLMVQVSLTLTFLNLMLYRICLASQLDGSPRLAAQFFFSTGSLKVAVGILIIFVFSPKCPDGCETTCSEVDLPSPFYGCIASIVGVLWLRRGYERYKMAQALQSDGSEGTNNKDLEFGPVSTMEAA